MKRFVSIICLLFLIVPPCYGDALIVVKAMTAPTIAEIFIEEDTVRIELEIGMADIKAFQDLLPDELYEKLGNEPLPFKERLTRFLESGFIIQADDEKLTGHLVNIGPRMRLKRDEISGEPLPVSDEEPEVVIAAVFEYPFEGRPKAITLMPPVNEHGFVTATIGFVVYHQSIPMNDFRYLSIAVSLELDWNDPWYSQCEQRNMRRRYSAPVSAFIYVEPYEVRKEIIIRPKDLQAFWLDLGLEGKTVIRADAQAALKKKVAEYLHERNRVLIDGKEIPPILDRINFIRRTLKTTSVIDPPEDIPIHAAMLGVIYVYPITGLPQEVTMHWEEFSPRIQKISAASTDEAGGLPYYLTPDDAVLRWQNFLKHPTIPSLVDLAPPPEFPTLFGLDRILGNMFPIKDEDADAIIVGLLRNIYHAFDFRNESHSYDILARSAEGDLLTDVYLETRRSLVLKSQGGAQVKIKEVAMVASETTPLKNEIGFRSHCTWNVAGWVGHWGHIHMRRNQYQAQFTVKAVDGAWRIIALEIMSEKRL